jgi:uncharacterized protein (DUF302 family)
MSGQSPFGVIEHLSPRPFSETVERLDHAMMDHGMTIFARIDHAANARDAGLTMPPATLLIYGKAEGGTPIMVASPNAALDLPLRVLIREDRAGRAIICFHPIAPQLEALGVEPTVAARLQHAQALVLEALED